MIALLAAVAEESRLIRETLQNPVQDRTTGIALLRGQLFGRDICLAHSGIGKAAAAAAAVGLCQGVAPQALCLFGCGGAYPGSGLGIGDLALADTEIFADEGVATHDGFLDLAALDLPMRPTPVPRYNSWPLESSLCARAGALLSDWPQAQPRRLATGAFATVSTGTGRSDAARAIAERTGAICENMEGAAVALACRQMDVPMLEIRGISNLVEDRDTSRWDLPAGMTAAEEAVLHLLDNWARCIP